MSKFRRGFHWTEKAWYDVLGKSPEVIFGLYHEDGSVKGEIAMRWHDAATTWAKGGDARLEAWDDSWEVLVVCVDFLNKLADLKGKTPTPTEVVEILKSCGFEDMTEYQEPSKSLVDRKGKE